MSGTTHISIGCDHAGYDYKDDVINELKELGYSVYDHGTNSTDSRDYPDHIHPVGQDIDSGKTSLGIILCGSGNGAAMTANKHPQVRAALCWTPELAALAAAPSTNPQGACLRRSVSRVNWAGLRKR